MRRTAGDIQMTSTAIPAPLGGLGSDLKIINIEAYAPSYPLAQTGSVTLGVGRAIKRDAVGVKVTTAGGSVGYGEPHHGRSHTGIARLVNVPCRQATVVVARPARTGPWP